MRSGIACVYVGPNDLCIVGVDVSTSFLILPLRKIQTQTCIHSFGLMEEKLSNSILNNLLLIFQLLFESEKAICQLIEICLIFRVSEIALCSESHQINVIG